ARVPDTLDLAERAKLAINGLTGCVKPQENYAAYLRVNFERDKKKMKMSQQDLCPGKVMDALVLARIMSGSNFKIEVDQKWRERFLEEFKENVPLLTGADGGRFFSYMATNYIYEHDKGWKYLGEKALERLEQEVVDKGDYAYISNISGLYGTLHKGKGMPKGWDATFHGWVLQGVTRFYVSTGSSKAKVIAGKFANYLKNYAGIFDDKGHFIAVHYFTGRPALHFAHNATVLEALMEYALATNDKSLGEFVQKSYRWLLTTGSPLIGFFPEYIKLWPDNRRFEDTETCAIAYMIQLAVELTEMGIDDYWDDVDRFLRNQFAENQLPMYDSEGKMYWWHKVAGVFASWAFPNEFNAPSNIWTTFSLCCTVNAVRAMYKVWDKMIDYDKGNLQVNLLLNRASKWVDIHSYIPYEGRVDVRVKQPLNSLLVKSPEWIKAGSKEVICKVNGNAYSIEWEGRYIKVSSLKEGDLVVLTFPLSERVVKEVIGKVNGKPVEYTFIIRGNNVVNIKPPSRYEPHYYQKGKYYRNGEVRWKRVERFVIDQ
ncbi:MAG: hypothetical protein DRQ02_12405, partial [Candidatus Latescibacterota bacterium]